VTPPKENHFDGWHAANYDATVADRFDARLLGPCVDVLAELAGDGRALEFAIGTGRVALPLTGRGVDVVGIEFSPAMVEQLRAKPGGDALDVTLGDMTEVRVDGTFSLVYLVFNTINNLLTQEEQVACFANAAAHLAPGGCFVIEVGVPALRWLPPGERIRPFDVSPTHLGFDEYDVATQWMASHHLYKLDGSWQEFSMPFRYVWPSELDLMARLAGLRLRDRWAGWNRSPFTADSLEHVSVWQKPVA
jgi:SAM-dependent methyltransferase